MAGQHTRLNQSIALATLVVVLAVALSWVRLGQGHAAFCRRVFANLANGRPSVSNAIDWEHLQAIGTDVGSAYRQLPSAREKAHYREAFIAQFAEGFRQSGGTVDAFTDWRIHEQRDGRVVVAADYPAKQQTLLVSIPRVGKKRIQAIQWE